jgi:ectoine hydroxylase-related dioxygenase (phytanoyl-CoA dioxygenase family)
MICSGWTFRSFVTLNLVVSGAAFVPPSNVYTRLPLVSQPLDRQQHINLGWNNGKPLMAKKRQQKQLQTGESNPKSVDISNLLSNMGIQQVNSGKNNTKTQRKKKKEEVATTTKQRTAFPDINIRTQLDYARNGHAVLRNFIIREDEAISERNRLSVLRNDIVDLALDEALKAWIQKVQVAAGADVAATCLSIPDCKQALRNVGVTASLPFLQYFNTWRKLKAVKDLATDLGKAASILLDVPTVRLYQDAVFWKRSQDGPTPWHADARMAPFDTSHMITFWIPLQTVPSPTDGGTALIFCSKSHADFALPYWNPPPGAVESDAAKNSQTPSGWDRLEDRYPKKVVDYMPMNLGDVTVHSGWTLHCSNGNEVPEDRIALAITFVDGSAEIRLDWQTVGDDEDRWSYQEWCKDVKPRTSFSHDLVPIVYPLSQQKEY